MVDVVKHVFKYAEQRATKFLNLTAKDDFGRHRGSVVYGLLATPTANNTVEIGAGCLYTPWGTRFYYDVEGPRATVSLATHDLPIGDRPYLIALVARVTFGPEGAARSIAIDSAGDMPSKLEFRAFRVDWKHHDDVGPLLSLSTVNPVEMVGSQVNVADSMVDTVQQYGPTGDETAPGGSFILDKQDILIGHIVVGVTPAGAALSPLCTVAGWADGVSYAPIRNAWEQLSDLLGFDVLLGRHVATTTALTPGYTALNQLPSPANTLQSLQSPRHGTPAPPLPGDGWETADWSTYRLPSFLRDGEALLWQMRRLDVILRLWLDRTGDQSLVQLIQDGGGVDLDPMAPIDQVLRAFDGTTGSGNQNEVTFALASTAANNAAALNYILKSGKIPHVPPGVDEHTSLYGDSTRRALGYLEHAVRHVLGELLGVQVNRDKLRATGALVLADVAGAVVDRTAGQQLVTTLTTGATTAYEPSFALAAILNRAAQRSLAGGANLLKNPVFASWDISAAPGPSNLPVHWTYSGAATLGRLTPVTGRNALALTMAGTGGTLSQLVTGDLATTFAQWFSGGTGMRLMSAAATLRVDVGSVVLRVVGRNAASAVVLDVQSAAIPATNVETNVSFSWYLNAMADLKTLELRVEFTSAGGTAVVSGAWLGAGVPPLCAATAGQSTSDDFVSRDGGTNSAMQGHLFLAGYDVFPGVSEASTILIESPQDYTVPGAGLSWSPPTAQPQLGDTEPLVSNVVAIKRQAKSFGGGQLLKNPLMRQSDPTGTDAPDFWETDPSGGTTATTVAGNTTTVTGTNVTSFIQEIEAPGPAGAVVSFSIELTNLDAPEGLIVALELAPSLGGVASAAAGFTVGSGLTETVRLSVKAVASFNVIRVRLQRSGGTNVTFLVSGAVVRFGWPEPAPTAVCAAVQDEIAMYEAVNLRTSAGGGKSNASTARTNDSITGSAIEVTLGNVRAGHGGAVFYHVGGRSPALAVGPVWDVNIGGDNYLTPADAPEITFVSLGGSHQGVGNSPYTVAVVPQAAWVRDGSVFFQIADQAASPPAGDSPYTIPGVIPTVTEVPADGTFHDVYEAGTTKGRGVLAIRATETAPDSGVFTLTLRILAIGTGDSDNYGHRYSRLRWGLIGA